MLHYTFADCVVLPSEPSLKPNEILSGNTGLGLDGVIFKVILPSSWD